MSEGSQKFRDMIAAMNHRIDGTPDIPLESEPLAPIKCGEWSPEERARVERALGIEPEEPDKTSLWDTFLSTPHQKRFNWPHYYAQHKPWPYLKGPL